MPPLFIDTQSRLDEQLQRWREAPFLALDTEFVREQTYWPQLCLIQIGDGHGEACIDVRAGLDLRALLELLQRPQATRVFHAAGQDLEIFVRLAGRCPAPLFDTQIAAALLGYGEQLGYAGLVEKMTGILIDKRLARTDWTRRPLSAAELAYAADDVRHLAAVLYPQLRDALDARGRLGWLEEDCTALADPARYLPAPAQEWQRLKGLGRLDAAAQHVAARLAEWREIEAEQRDRPRRWILSDDALYALAERRPRTLEQLSALQALPPKSLERHGRTLLDLIASAADTARPPLVHDLRASEAEKARLKRLADRARALAEAQGVPASLLAPRADIEALATRGAQADIPLLRGWRRVLAGEELLTLAARA